MKVLWLKDLFSTLPINKLILEEFEDKFNYETLINIIINEKNINELVLEFLEEKIYATGSHINFRNS